jgi:hypothetical protein
MWQIIIGVSLVVLAVSLHTTKTFEGFKAAKVAKSPTVSKTKAKTKAKANVPAAGAAGALGAAAASGPALNRPIKLYLLDYKNDKNMFIDNTQIAVLNIPGPHTPEMNDDNFINPVEVGMNLTWPSNKSGPATVTGVFVAYNVKDSTIHNVMYITLDKPVDPTSTIFTLTSPNSIKANTPASVIKQGFQSYQNPYNSSPAVKQTLEFRLGQNSYSKQVQNNWLM